MSSMMSRFSSVTASAGGGCSRRREKREGTQALWRASRTAEGACLLLRLKRKRYVRAEPCPQSAQRASAFQLRAQRCAARVNALSESTSRVRLGTRTRCRTHSQPPPPRSSWCKRVCTAGPHARRVAALPSAAKLNRTGSGRWNTTARAASRQPLGRARRRQRAATSARSAAAVAGRTALRQACVHAAAGGARPVAFPVRPRVLTHAEHTPYSAVSL
jgi:hypothetical protein